jgi:hypothetical protein
MKWIAGVLVLALASTIFGGETGQAQDNDNSIARSNAASPVVPQLMRYAGVAANRAGDTVEAVFRVYSSPESGASLWSETQTVTADATGRFSVLLGAATAGGLPQALFSSGQGQWLAVSIERGAEQGRTKLASVAYAMKAADAESLAGRSAADFVTQAQLALVAKDLAQKATPLIMPLVTPSGSGTTNYVPLWTSSSALGNSAIYQSGTSIGIGTLTPSAPLDVVGPATKEPSLVLQGGGGFGTLKMGADVNTNTLTPSIPSWRASPCLTGRLIRWAFCYFPATSAEPMPAISTLAAHQPVPNTLPLACTMLPLPTAQRLVDVTERFNSEVSRNSIKSSPNGHTTPAATRRAPSPLELALKAPHKAPSDLKLAPPQAPPVQDQKPRGM